MADKIPISVLIDKNKKAGQFFFEQGAMRFFSSRLPKYGYKHGDKAYFITSEQFISSAGVKFPRKYTIRVEDLTTGKVETVGAFNELSKGEANTKLMEILSTKVKKLEKVV